MSAAIRHILEHPLFDVAVQATRTDIDQLLEFGVDTMPLLEELADLAALGSLDELLRFQMRLWDSPQPADFPYDEPSDAETIRAQWPRDDATFNGERGDLHDKLAGAWLGRAAGCCLGKPLELGLDRRQVQEICEALGSWPLHDYLNPWPEGRFPAPTGKITAGRHRSCTRGLIDHCPNDDDINYPLASLTCLEQHGLDWSPTKLFRLIADITPYGSLWSSGKNGARAAIMEMRHPAGQLFGNPTRQSLGAMIRCDTWALVSPGNVPQAADFALRDALFTQTRNGIYAGVFWTVAIAEALSSDSPSAALEKALAFVPPMSRFAEMVAQCRGAHATSEWATAVDELYANHSEHFPESAQFNHALVNSGLVILGLLYGEGDFTRTIGLTVSGGRDTDCTGATAGSMMGAAYGLKRIPDRWYRCFNDSYRSVMAGCHNMKLTDVIARTERLALEYGRFSLGMDA